MEQIAITDKISYLVPPKQAQTSFLGCSGLLIGDSLVALIDGNMGPEDTPRLLKTACPDICVVSHYHGDHSRYAAEVLELSEATLYLPVEERRYLLDFSYFIEQCGIADKALAKVWFAWLTEVLKLRPVHHAEALCPNDVIDTGSMKLEVIPAPGHSPGHQAYWEPKQRILFCTDIGVDSFGPWYGWKDANLEDYIHSILRLIALDARLLVTSHGGIIAENVRGSLEQCLNVLLVREQQIMRDLDRGLDRQACAAKGHIYGDFSRFPNPLDRIYAVWEQNMVDEHIRLLQKGGIGQRTSFSDNAD